MTNDYAALVAMLDQAAADLQAEIDAAIDRHGLLVRTADSLRTEAEQVWHPGTRVLDDIDTGTRWVYVPDSGWSITQEPTIHADLPLPAQLIAAQLDATAAAEPVAILSVHERCTQEQRDALKQRLASDNRWQYVIDPANNTGRWTIQLDGRAQTIDGPPPAPGFTPTFRVRS